MVTKLRRKSKFQRGVDLWMHSCFGEVIACDKKERNHRFLEEALELVQACECPQDEAHMLVDYVYGRDTGKVNQEVGGVMITLAALCSAQGLNMAIEGERERSRVWKNIPTIRAKQAAKPQQADKQENWIMVTKRICESCYDSLPSDLARCPRCGYRDPHVRLIRIFNWVIVIATSAAILGAAYVAWSVPS